MEDLAAGRQERFERCSDGAWSEAGRYFACGGADFAFDADAFKRIPLPATLSSPPFVGGGHLVRLAARRGGPSQPVQLWSLESKSLVGEPYGDGFGLRWSSPNGKFELWIVGPNAYLTDVLRGTHRLIAGDASDPIYYGSELFAPNGAQIALPVAHGGVRLVDVLTGESHGMLSASGCETATTVAFSPRGDVVAVGSFASLVCIYDLGSNALVRSWAAPKPADPTVDNPIGIMAFAGGGDGLVVGHLYFPEWVGVASLYRLSGEFVADLGSTLTADIKQDASSSSLKLSCARVDRKLEVRRADPSGPLVANDRQTCIEPLVDTLPIPPLDHQQEASFVSVDPTNTKVLGTVNGRARVWSLKTGKILYAR